MSNGHACCVLGICCPPDKQRDALAARINTWKGSRPAAVSTGAWIALQLLANFDLAPKGAAAAIKELHPTEAMPESLMKLYAPLFAEAQAKG